LPASKFQVWEITGELINRATRRVQIDLIVII
jgi:hypothetical protein